MASGPDLPRRLVPIIAGQAFGLGCGVAGIHLTTALVPPERLGPYSIFLSFAPVGMWAVHAGVIKYTARHWAGADHRPALLRQITRAAARKLPWLLLACAVGAWVSGGIGVGLLLPLLFVTATLLSIATLTQTALQAARDHWRDTAVLAAAALTRSFLPPLLFFAAGGSAIALYLGFSLHAVIFAAAGLWALSGTLHATTGAPRVPAAVPEVYEGPLFIGLAVTGWTLLSLGRWVTAWFFGPTETGYFALASNLATLAPAVLATIFLMYVQPLLFAAKIESVEERRALARRVDRVALFHATGALAGLVVLRLLLPWLIGSLIDVRYAGIIERVLPAGCFALAITTGQFYHVMLLAGRREAGCGPSELSAAAVLIAGTVIAAALGMEWFLRWLLISPVVPWLVNRPLARRALLAEA